MTLVRQFGVFTRRLATVGSVLAMTAAPAWASEYTAQLQTCFPATVALPLPETSTTGAVSVVGDADTRVGGSAYAGGVVSGFARAFTPAPNALVGDVSACQASAIATYDDIVIAGPAGMVTVSVHVQFGASITQRWEQLTDAVHGGASIASSNTTELNVVANFADGAAVGWLKIIVKRQSDEAIVTPVLTRGAEYAPLPPNPHGGFLDAGGYVTFDRLFAFDVASGPFVGLEIDEYDRVRGEIILTATVPANQALKLHLDLNAKTDANAFSNASAFGTVDATQHAPLHGEPVFELPEDYTVDAPSLGIVDNIVPASFTCPRPVTDWRNHPEQWPEIVHALTLGHQNYQKDELLTLLNTFAAATRPDASVTLAQQLIAAKINRVNGSNPDPVELSIDDADALLAGFAGALPYNVRPTTAIGRQMMVVAAALNDYNAGRRTPVCTP